MADTAGLNKAGSAAERPRYIPAYKADGYWKLQGPPPDRVKMRQNYYLQNRSHLPVFLFRKNDRFLYRSAMLISMVIIGVISTNTYKVITGKMATKQKPT